MFRKRMAALGGIHVKRVSALEFVTGMRGGSQPKLLRCSDGRYYVVKFQNNPQGLRMLASELLATLLARILGLPVPDPAIVDVHPNLVRATDKLAINRGWQSVRCCPGLSFGSCYGAGEAQPDGTGDSYDLLPSDRLCRVTNLPDFAGMLAFDKWVGNTDHRQVVFARANRTVPFRAYMIDNGLCFNGRAWDFPDKPRCGLYPCRTVYANVSGIETFDPWVSRIEQNLGLDVLVEAAKMIPPEWYRGRRKSLWRLLVTLEERRARVRDLLRSTYEIASGFFPRRLERSAMLPLKLPAAHWQVPNSAA